MLKREPMSSVSDTTIKKKINLALQGGGAHGAFTWGVLDALLEDGRLEFEAISGTSAGAMNAVVLAEGWIENGVQGARKQLEQFWQGVSEQASLSSINQNLFESLLGQWMPEGTPAALMADMWSRVVSPYAVNPLNLNPLKGVLEELIDFKKVQACKEIKLFIAATSVRSGKVKVFEGESLTADKVMASACLPNLFQAVEIEGEAYWDGGYMGNPVLFPFFYNTRSEDIVLVQINPLERVKVPTTAQEINNRMTEIIFNAGLLHELRAIKFVGELIKAGKLSSKEYKNVRMHRIDGTGWLDDLSASSRMSAQWSFFMGLRDKGRKAAQGWLKNNFDKLGQEATLNIDEAIS